MDSSGSSRGCMEQLLTFIRTHKGILLTTEINHGDLDSTFPSDLGIAPAFHSIVQGEKVCFESPRVSAPTLNTGGLQAILVALYMRARCRLCFDKRAQL
uniref:Uncharacterized protein n=1 Tax=Sphaerodactylus townsendi TaxID=933632 RepID=A0ACB8EPQ4_9SAUR